MIAAGAVVGLTLFGIAPAAYAADGDEVALDAALLACVNEFLGNGPTSDPVTELEASTVTVIACGQSTVSSLTGLEYFTNLEVLDLNQNSVSDVSALTNLTNLTDLYLAYNTIGDITPVLDLPALERLSLSGNGDLSSNLVDIGELTTLTHLRLGASSISNVASLANLTSLEQLDLRSNSVSNVTPLASLTMLDDLNLTHNSISDISALASLTVLSTLGLSRNQIVDLSPLETMPIALTATDQEVDLGVLTVGVAQPNPVRNAAGVPVVLDDFYDAVSNTFTPTMAGLGSTEWHNGPSFDGTLSFNSEAQVVLPDDGLRGCVNEDLSQGADDAISVSQAASITDLDCSSLGVVDLSGIEALTSLEGLMLDDNDITDVTALSGLPALRFLSLGNNAITDVEPLGTITTLQALLLSSNDGTIDLSKLTPLTGLLNLELASNGISDVSELAVLEDLIYLVLLDNDLTSADLADLAGLTALVGLDLGKNNLTKVNALASLTQLEFLYLDNNAIVDVRPLSAIGVALSAQGQVVELGDLAIDVDVANPVIQLNGDAIPLDSLYDSATNTFTPIAYGAGSTTWSNSDHNFTGTLNFTVPEETLTDGGDDGTDTDTDTDTGTGTNVGDPSDSTLAQTGFDATSGGIAAAGLLLAGGMMITRTRRLTQ
ncbi:leucine-rich repeat domain-containing protein [Demequina aurantiaca]|uniref:leucine-rich repeat domain-containing protein n=1 Tax=Demequina aurantiaca TaxID=676200 RepID=UPI003D33A1C2